MCGDHYQLLSTAMEEGGSPPHVRGPRLGHTEYTYYGGITPACAGTTKPCLLLLLLVGDHPRMCGDHYQLLSTAMEEGGSPPHVRGPPNMGWKATFRLGITPACAGTTHIRRKNYGG